MTGYQRDTIGKIRRKQTPGMFVYAIVYSCLQLLRKVPSASRYKMVAIFIDMQIKKSGQDKMFPKKGRVWGKLSAAMV